MFTHFEWVDEHKHAHHKKHQGNKGCQGEFVVEDTKNPNMRHPNATGDNITTVITLVAWTQKGDEKSNKSDE